MAKTAAERRAARKRKDQRRDRPRSPGEHVRKETPDREAVLRRLLYDGAFTGDPRQPDRSAAALAELDPGVDQDGFVTHLLIGLIRGMYERGWQPADVAHVVRRAVPRRVTRLAVGAIAEEARATGASARAPEDWVAQLAALGTLDSPHPAVIARWRRSEGLLADEAWRDVLLLFRALDRRGDLQPLLPPPSRWGARQSRPARSGPPGDARVLGRIRALLAQAESTTFPDEAEAFSAKAQTLMTRHAVDAAVLGAARGGSPADEVGARRVHIDNPYPETKVSLLGTVATVNGVRTIWLERLGIVTMVGLPVDLESVELLFTSLLVQATTAMAATGSAGGGHTRSPSFRRGFLTAYAVRIGERLDESRAQATEDAARTSGQDLVPVLRARDQAVDDTFEKMFPDTYAVSARRIDARGWHAGRLAAETADLGSGRDEVST